MGVISLGLGGSIAFADNTSAAQVNVYRLYNTSNLEHLYTTDKNEYNRLPQISKDWKREGVNYQNYNKNEPGVKPVYRVYNPKSGEHMLTSDSNEKKTLIAKHGWKDEKISFYAPTQSSKPVYRVFNAAAGIGAHHMTADATERKTLITKHKWKDEGIAFNAATANDSTHQANKTSVKVKNSTLTVGDTWKPADNFVSATDKDGKAVAFSQVKVSGNVDTSKAGTYAITYTYGGKTAKATVTVKDLVEPTLVVKDSTISINTEWKAEDNFVSATDNRGNKVAIDKITVTGTVDTSETGKTEITYEYEGLSTTATVKVINPNPVDNGDGTVTYMDKEWSVIKDMGDGNKMIALDEKIGTTTFTPGKYFFNYNVGNVDDKDGYFLSNVKAMIDAWYQGNIAGTDYEPSVRPVNIPTVTLNDLKGIGWNSREDAGDVDMIDIHKKLPQATTVDEKGTKQAFAMSTADVSVVDDRTGRIEITDEAYEFTDRLTDARGEGTWLRSSGNHATSAAFLSAGSVVKGSINSLDVMGNNQVVPTLVVHVE